MIYDHKSKSTFETLHAGSSKALSKAVRQIMRAGFPEGGAEENRWEVAAKPGATIKESHGRLTLNSFADG